MTIIELGTGNRAKCDCCNSVIEFKATEIQAAKRTLDSEFFVDCPRCEFRIILPGTLPRSVRDQTWARLEASLGDQGKV